MTPAYLKEVIAGGTAASSHRFALVVAVLSLGLSTIILSIAACLGQDTALALGAVTVPLGGLGGFVYGKAQGDKPASTEPPT